MAQYLQREIEKVNGRLLALGDLVEQQAETAIRALCERDAKLAREVERRDAEVDRREIEVEEECLRMLVLYQPVARDLRLVVAVLKINNDLERIGDLAVNIAHKAAALATEPALTCTDEVGEMWGKTRAMLYDALQAVVKLDGDLARSVCDRDDEVDRLKHEARGRLEALIGQNPDQVKPLLRLLAIYRNLERMADCATNIAEDVIYLVEGRIVRHGGAHQE